jgi:pilus assembly protein CpaB
VLFGQHDPLTTAPFGTGSRQSLDAAANVLVARGVTAVTGGAVARGEFLYEGNSLGTISFSLRPLADTHADLERALASGEVKLPDNATPEQEEKLLKAALGQPSDGKTSYVTGGDVSRFQRSSVPPAAAAPAGGGQTGVPAAPVYRGPVIKVRRGNTVSDEAIGRNGSVYSMSVASGARAPVATSQPLPNPSAQGGT